MALNFPDSPSLNDIYTDLASGFSYQWDGTAWQSYTPTSAKNILIIDDVSGSFNGSTDTFALVSNGVAIIPANAQQLRVTLGGIVQKPTVDYTVASSNITFTTPPAGGLSCSIVSLGPAVPVNTIADGSITPAKLSTGGPSWNTGGDVVITGTGSTALLVNGNARVTGILTVGSSSITIDGGNNEISIGSLVINESGISGTTPDLNIGNIVGVAATFTGNLSIGGTLTYEDVTNVDSIGLITARSGIQFGISGVGGTITSGGDAEFAGIVTSVGGFNLGISSAGTAITSGPIKTLNFVGTGNTFAVNGTTVDISIQGGGGSSGVNPVTYFLN